MYQFGEFIYKIGFLIEGTVAFPEDCAAFLKIFLVSINRYDVSHNGNGVSINNFTKTLMTLAFPIMEMAFP